MYIENIASLYKIDQINIINEDIFYFIKSSNCKLSYNFIDLKSLIQPSTIVLLNHLLIDVGGKYKINQELFDDISNNCIYEKLIFIIHDYHLIFPSNPNPVKNESINDVPEKNDLIFVNNVFSKCDTIVFNSYNCFNNYNKFIDMGNYKYIITNTTPDILTNNYNIAPSNKPTYNIGIVGRIYAKHKGLELIKNINNILPQDKFVFKIFGSDERSLPQPNYYDSNVHLCGSYKNEDIFKLIDQHQIDCFMFVSIFEETWSYTLSIAMQTGLPIFYNDIGSYRERLYGRNNTYAFDENALHELPHLIQNLENSTLSSNHIRCETKMEVFNNNADFNWMLENNANIIFNTSMIESYLIHNNVCFFHFTNIGRGYQIFLEQIQHIKSSGLYDKLDFIFIVMLGPHIKLNNDPKFKVIYYSPNPLEWEFPTIKLIKNFSDNINKKVNLLYMHTKGTLDKPHAKEWREYLEHFLISKYSDCLYYLNNGRDGVGVNVNLHPKNGPNATRCHFSGNFWWSNTDYIKSLTSNLTQEDRYSTEHFIIGKYYSQQTNIITLHNCENNLYENPILPHQYNFSIIKNQVLNEYNTFHIDNYNKTVCVYFISTINTSESRFFTQINEMINSGFYDACEHILAFICGHNDNIMSKLSTMSKVQIIQTNNNEMEKFSLNNYKNYIHLDNYNIVYLHTKGASHSLENTYINDWCKICNYFTITMWKLNVILLQYYSCTGINLMSYPVPHFSGNFWWATSRHISHLKPNIGNNYLDPEMYLLNNIHLINLHDKQYQPNPLCIFKSIGHHAGANYDESMYKDISVKQILDKIPENYIYNNIGDNIPINIDRVTPIE